MHMLFGRGQPIIGLDNYHIQYSDIFSRICEGFFFFSLKSIAIKSIDLKMHYNGSDAAYLPPNSSEVDKVTENVNNE